MATDKVDICLYGHLYPEAFVYQEGESPLFCTDSLFIHLKVASYDTVSLVFFK